MIIALLTEVYGSDGGAATELLHMAAGITCGCGVSLEAFRQAAEISYVAQAEVRSQGRVQ